MKSLLSFLLLTFIFLVTFFFNKKRKKKKPLFLKDLFVLFPDFPKKF